jgi:hypothetical protein
MLISDNQKSTKKTFRNCLMFYWMAITQNGAEFKGQTENKK